MATQTQICIRISRLLHLFSDIWCWLTLRHRPVAVSGQNKSNHLLLIHPSYGRKVRDIVGNNLGCIYLKEKIWLLRSFWVVVGFIMLVYCKFALVLYWYNVAVLRGLIEKINLTSPTIHQISHNAPFCNRNMHTCAHFCYKVVHCGMWDWWMVGFVRWI